MSFAYQISEKLLQYIWQFQLFVNTDFVTAEGMPLNLLHQGSLNNNQGPDFTDGRVSYHETVWVGNIELHVRSSDWFEHGHSSDCNYKNVILHVVWIHDATIELPFPTLVIKDYVDEALLLRFSDLMKIAAFVACDKEIGVVDEIVVEKWKERLLAERLLQKAQLFLKEWEQTKGDWDEVCWRYLAKSYGGKVNGEGFYQLARSLPWKQLKRERADRFRLEALLLGQAGLLEEELLDDYFLSLKKEYAHLTRKWNLQPIRNSMYLLRMRPSNFPALRISQLAGFIHLNEYLLSGFLHTKQIFALKSWMTSAASSYWDHHYRFGDTSAYLVKKTGESFLEAIVINTIVPAVFAFGLHHQDDSFCKLAIEWLSALDAESNGIVDGFKKTGLKVQSAFDSQALIQMKLNYCDKKLCLDCSIGNAVLNKPQQRL